MDAPETVTVGVVLYGPDPIDTHELEIESARAADIASRVGAKKAFGQAIALRIASDTWRVIVARQSLPDDTVLLASIHFFADHPDPLQVASALAVFAHAWRYRREHGKDAPGNLPLSDLPPGPLASKRTLRDAATDVNALMLDGETYAEWIRAYEAIWSGTGD